jgi:tetratricopeptide (TPR) repeat protein
MPADVTTAGGEFAAGRERAEAALRRGELDEALKQFRAVLFQFESRLSAADRADVYAAMARIKAAQHDGKQARNLFEKALGLDGAHRGAMEGLVELFAQLEEHELLVETKRRLADLLAGEDRIRQLVEAGDVCVARLKDVPRGIVLYEEALSIDPAHRMAQLKLFQACRGAEMWAEAIAVCEGIVASEPDPKKRATWHFFLAETFHERVDDDEKALAEYEKVLDAEPDDPDSLAAIEQLLVKAEDWAALDAAWQRQVARLEPRPGTATRRETLLHELGENARLRLADLPKAAEYHRRALELNPDQRGRRELLAGIYAQIPERWADAVREHQRLLRGDPKKIDSYHQMRGILRDAGRADEVWCVCAALVHLGRAEPAEVQFYEQYRPKGALGSIGVVAPEAWLADLYHPDENRDVSLVGGAIAPALGRLWAQSQKEFGLRKKDQHDPRSSPLALAKALHQAGAALDVPLPELYVVPRQPGGLIFAVTDPPASVAGQDFLAGLAPAELRFVAGHHVAACRREHYVAYLLAVAAATLKQPLPVVLQTYLDAAVKHVVPDAAVEKTDALVRTIKALQPKLLPLDLDVLQPAAEALAARPDRNPAKWLCAVDLTSDRAGLLLCGDLVVAAKMVPRVPSLTPELGENRRLDELLCFAVSEEFFRLRRMLGVALASG